MHLFGLFFLLVQTENLMKQEQDAPVKVIKYSSLANNSLSDTFKSVYEVMHAYFLQGTNI